MGSLHNHKNELGFEIRELELMLGRYIESESAKNDILHLKGPQGWAIGFLNAHQDKPMYQKDIEHELSIRKPTASRLIDRMEKNGYVERRVSAEDKRWKEIVLTQKAKDEIQLVDNFIAGVEAKLRKNLSDAEIKQFLQTLGKIKKNLEE